jgi:hypothetical protein
LNISSFRVITNPYSEYFAVLTEKRLYIADAIHEALIDTCLELRDEITSMVVSPTGELAVSDGERITIINFDDDTHYIAAYHEGSVFDWRVPPQEN